MASFEELLMQTMPLAGAKTAYSVDNMAAHYTQGVGGDVPPVDFPSLFGGEPIAIGDSIKVVDLSLDESYTVDKPDIDASDYDTPEDVSIWRWSHDASNPSVISDVWCRVRSADYKSYKVLDSIEWGLETPDARGPLKPCIRIQNLIGKPIELPLGKEFVAYKAAIVGGRIAEGQTDLWKLPSKLDKSLVIAFIYSVQPDGPPQPMTAADANDLKDGFMPTGAAAAPVAADVHGQASAGVDNARVLVILSLTTCKQNDDFAPGSVVGMGRIYPHVMVMSNAPLSRIDATVRLNRPDSSTIIDEDKVTPPDEIGKDKLVNDSRGPKDCCGTYDRPPEIPKPPPEPIGSVLFADANDFEIATLGKVGPNLPFWGNFFSYYWIPADDGITANVFDMVSHFTARCEDRTSQGTVLRQVVTGPKDYDQIRKMPYQGDFDNLHMAPKMRLYNVTRVTHLGGDIAVPYDVDPGSLQIEKITMAPFCSHDCLHTHWRWGKDATDPAQCGFEGMVPYAKPGKPLVPDNQTVALWLRAANLATYTATVWAFPDKPIPQGQWQVIMHHGSAYALDITGVVKAYMAKLAVDAFAGQPRFYGKPKSDIDDGEITSDMSFSLFYWRLRWETVLVDGKPQLRERIVNKQIDYYSF